MSTGWTEVSHPHGHGDPCTANRLPVVKLPQSTMALHVEQPNDSTVEPTLLIDE